jgi:hypothetical protein
VARGVEALSWERVGRGYNLIFKLFNRFTTTKKGDSGYNNQLKTAKSHFYKSPALI